MFLIVSALFPIFVVRSQYVGYSSPSYDYKNSFFYRGIPLYFKNSPYADTHVDSSEEYEHLISKEDRHEEDIDIYDPASGEYYSHGFPLTYTKENSGVKEIAPYDNLGLPLYKEYYSKYSVPHHNYSPSDKLVVTSSTANASPSNVPGASYYVKTTKYGTSETKPIYNTDYKVKLAKGEVSKQSANVSKEENTALSSKHLPQRKLFNMLKLFPPKASSVVKDSFEEVEPYPYSFGYKVSDHYGNSQYRNEVGENTGAKRGSYGYIDAHGIKREVHYVADHKGFRAWIKTNEPGMSNSNPANVAITAEKPPYIVQHSQAQKKPVYPLQASLTIPSYYAAQPSYLSTLPLVTKHSGLIKKPLFSNSFSRKPLLTNSLAKRPLFSKPWYTGSAFTQPFRTALTNQAMLKWPVVKQPYG